ncbi:hypothetical protein ACH5RR_023323 [Cinchona calisaya]|uniref:Uncharacterized protein n=1 Tax=Cinchona calisaya TaxID=153742 RepID=A0ABD2ZAB5_9GENT
MLSAIQHGHSKRRHDQRGWEIGCQVQIDDRRSEPRRFNEKRFRREGFDRVSLKLNENIRVVYNLRQTVDEIGRRCDSHADHLDIGMKRVRDIVQRTIVEANNLRERIGYRKPYPEWIDHTYDFPRGFRFPNFTKFFGDDHQSTPEHIGLFTI